MRIKKNIVIGIVVTLMMLLSSCGGSDNVNSRGKANEVSLKGGVLAIVPELRMDMAFNKIPKDWLPPYKDFHLNNDCIQIAFPYAHHGSQEIITKYMDVDFYTYFLFDMTTPILLKSEMGTKPIIKSIHCESKDRVDQKQAEKIFESLKSQYGKPSGSVPGIGKNSVMWKDGAYKSYFYYSDGKLNIGMERNN